MPRPEKLKHKMLAQVPDGDGWMDRRTGVTLYALSTILQMAVALKMSEENRFWYSMQIVSQGDDLHEMLKLFSGKNEKKYFRMSSAEFFTQHALR